MPRSVPYYYPLGHPLCLAEVPQQNPACHHSSREQAHMLPPPGCPHASSTPLSNAPKRSVAKKYFSGSGWASCSTSAGMVTGCGSGSLVAVGRPWPWPWRQQVGRGGQRTGGIGPVGGRSGQAACLRSAMQVRTRTPGLRPGAVSHLRPFTLATVTAASALASAAGQELHHALALGTAAAGGGVVIMLLPLLPMPFGQEVCHRVTERGHLWKRTATRIQQKQGSRLTAIV